MGRLLGSRRHAPEPRRRARVPFETLVVGHGDPLFTGGHEALAQAYSWLPGTTLANGLVLKPGGCG